MNKKELAKINTEITKITVRNMFGNDTKRYIGYFNVVDALITTGWCVISPERDGSCGLNFHLATKFVTIKKSGDDTLKLTFNKAKAIKSNEFKEALQVYYNKCSAKQWKLEQEKNKLHDIMLLIYERIAK